MNVYEYFNSMSLGLPFNTVISNFLVDLKVSTDLSVMHLNATLIVLLLLGDRRSEVQLAGEKQRRSLVQGVPQVELGRDQ